MTFAEAPTSVPFPPKHGPNASAHIKGGKGSPNVLFCAIETTTFTIIAVTGMLSIKAETIPDTHKIIIMASDSWYDCGTESIKSFVTSPMSFIKPRRSTISMMINIEAKNKSVGHSTFERIMSMSSLNRYGI